MNVVPINSLFDVRYGNSFDLTFLEECSEEHPDKINYISRTRENNGVSRLVKRLEDVEPFSSGLITVAGSGNSVLESFVQPYPFYTGYHVFVLFPKRDMSIEQKLFYCYCIRQNQYKYSFGRQANKTLKNLLIPSEIPKIFQNVQLQGIKPPDDANLNNKRIKLSVDSWDWFDLTGLFTITSSRDDLLDVLADGSTPYVTSTEFNNGILHYVDEEPANAANTITANRGGSVGHFFYQPQDYLVTPVDVRILTPKFHLNKYIGLFFITILKMEKYRFNYSRKMGTARLRALKIKLPAKSGRPDFQFMENYIKTLPYSVAI